MYNIKVVVVEKFELELCYVRFSFQRALFYSCIYIIYTLKVSKDDDEIYYECTKSQEFYSSGISTQWVQVLLKSKGKLILHTYTRI